MKQHRFKASGNDLRHPWRQQDDIKDRGRSSGEDGGPALLGHLVWSTPQSFAYGLEQPATDEQGDDRTEQQGLDDMRFARGQFIEAIVRFQLLKDELDLPACRVGLGNGVSVERVRVAETTARLCRLLREEVAEQLEQKSAPLTHLAKDWRKLLFPSATDEAFADGYAQAVTFGLLMPRARDIPLADGLDRVAHELRQTNTLIGAALRLLTDDADNQATLTRVLDAVDWATVSKGEPDAWLYFYENFLSVYDNELRKKTGSYYTPPDVVQAMVRLVDEALRSDERFGLSEGLASADVTVTDPATGTGTFLLGVLRRIAEETESDQGPGAVPGVVEAAISRLIGFEMQFGPFAVAQLRILAELQSLLDQPDATPAMRLFVTDTLGNPYVEEEYLPQILLPLGESRRRANAIKRQEKITVVIGNPPYKEKAKGLGGWIESGSKGANGAAPLAHWNPPASWSVPLGRIQST